MPYSAHSFSIACQDTLDQAREPGAKRMSVEVDGAYQQYDVTIHIPEESWAVILQPPALHVALEQIMDLLDGDESVLAWAEAELPTALLHETLASQGVRVSAHSDGDARAGITGVSAALAATGSLLLESGAGGYRSSSFLPDLHIALMTPEQLLPDHESWQEAQQARGYPAFRESRNTVIVTGPSKTADIGHRLVKGAHGPREVHIMILA